jgi:CheY-like chemotaxis protein
MTTHTETEILDVPLILKSNQRNYKYSHILLIDDADLDNFINENLLKANSFSKKVYLNSSARNALDFLKNLIIIGEKSIYPEVIFIDINMPIMDGFQFIEVFQKTVEKQFPDIKLVILTSSISPEDKEKAFTISEKITFLNKPITREMLDLI